MALGHPPYVGPVPADRAKLLYEVATLDSRGRLNYHTRWSERAGWGKDDMDVLFVLESPGLITCVPWDEHGPTILAKYSELELAQPPDWAGLGVLHDRYHRVSIGSDRRVTLSELMLVHLGIELESERRKLVATVRPGSIALMSLEERKRRTVEGSQSLLDLEGLP